jgi:hypothetical protein
MSESLGPLVSGVVTRYPHTTPAMRINLLSAIVLLALGATTASAQYRDAEFSAKREGSANAAGASRILIDARAGSLRVDGKPDLREVRASGTAWASSRGLLEEITLTTERRGTEVHVIVEMPENDGWHDDRQLLLDLVVEVPADIPVEIEDSSGEAEVVGVGGLEMSDGSGGLSIERIGGPLSVTDGSGSLAIANVRGDVRIRDGSGEIEVREVQGSVIVESDGSGEIDVQGVTGRVHVRSDGSGSIDARNVGGDFVVDRKGSGGIRYRDVKGEVDIPRNKREGSRE